MLMAKLKMAVVRHFRQRLLHIPTLEDVYECMMQARETGLGHAEIAWAPGKGKIFTLAVSLSMSGSDPEWKFSVENNGVQTQVWTHKSCDIPLIYNLIMQETGTRNYVNADGVLSVARDWIRPHPIHEASFVKIGVDDELLSNDTLQKGHALNTQRISSGRSAKTCSSASAVSRAVEMSLHEAQTGIFSFPAILFFLEQEYLRARRSRGNLSLLVMQLADGTSPIEDSRRVAKCVNLTKRKLDLFGHYNGRSFAMILPNTTSSGAQVVMRKVSKAAREAGIGIVHFGLASVPEHGRTLDVLLSCAEADIESQISESKLVPNLIA